MKRLLFVVLLVACGDNTLTWKTATDGWSYGWCRYAERCFPEYFARDFGDQDTCFAEVVKANCERDVYDCDDVYPHDTEDLDRCVEDITSLSCGAWRSPESCYHAFRQEGE